MSRAFGKFFFSSNFEACAHAAIDAVSNFHISCSWKLDGTCQIFKLMGAATFIKFSHYRSCKPASNFICARSCNSCIFARPPIKLEYRQYAIAAKLEIFRKIIIIIIIIIIPLLLYHIFKKISNFFRA